MKSAKSQLRRLPYVFATTISLALLACPAERLMAQTAESSSLGCALYPGSAGALSFDQFNVSRSSVSTIASENQLSTTHPPIGPITRLTAGDENGPNELSCIEITLVDIGPMEAFSSEVFQPRSSSYVETLIGLADGGKTTFEQPAGALFRIVPQALSGQAWDSGLTDATSVLNWLTFRFDAPASEAGGQPELTTAQRGGKTRQLAGTWARFEPTTDTIQF